MNVRTVRLAAGTLLALALLGGALAGTAAALTPYVVTLRPVGTTLDLGGTVRVQGTVPNGAPGQVVLLDELRGSTWVTVTFGRATPIRTFLLLTQPTTLGAHRYRARVAGTSTHGTGVSSTVTVTVYRWTYLSALRPSAGFMSTATVTINGAIFPSSKWSFARPTEPVPSVSYRLAGRCTTLHAGIGIGSDSPSNGSARMVVRADTRTVFDRVLRSPDRAAQVDLDVSGRATVTLSGTYLTGSRGLLSFTAPTFGSARIRCTF